jgi:GT2 family glycosyltransferase
VVGAVVNPLAIVPTYLRQTQDVFVLEACLKTMRETQPDLDILVVDDGSPDEELKTAAIDLTIDGVGGAFFDKEVNEGFAATVNVGLRQCLEEGRDAVLVNADIEFDHGREWLQRMSDTYVEDERASIVGALLLYPNGTIQHAGVYFSMLSRTFDHIYHYGPGNLPEAQAPRVCPVTAALQLITHECIADVGLYDENFRLGFEDVDYCVRAWQSGRHVVYNPRAIATHHESFFRSRPTPKIMRWQQMSWAYFAQKHATTNFAEFVPSLVAT